MDKLDDKTGTMRENVKRSLLLPAAGALLAVIALAILVAAGIGYRLGLWQFRTGFTILRFGGWFGLAAVVTSLAATRYARSGKRVVAIIMTLAGLAGGVAAFALPLQWKLAVQRLPRIHDITTDTFNPPRFMAIIPLRKNASNPIEYGGAEIAVLQRTAYPDIRTAVLDLPASQAFERAVIAARISGWQIVAAVPAEGRIEAIATTFWFGFKDDIVIRVVPVDRRSLVDIRSVSRVGISDAGANARRIRAYLKKLSGL